MAHYGDNSPQNKGRPLRISCDSNAYDNMGQRDQILHQINLSNVDNGFDANSALDADAELGSQLSQNFQGFTISSKRDLIHQMLTKSNGIIFNFQNIQQSLSDIFLSQ